MGLRSRRVRDRSPRLALLLLAGTTLAGAPGHAAEPSRAQIGQTTGYAIPPGPLSRALERFAIASGTQVLYDSQLTDRRTSPGVSGALPREDALRRLLAGTGLTGRIADSTVMLAQAAPVAPAPPTAVRTGLDPAAVELPPVDVQAGRPDVAGFALQPEYPGGQVARGGRVGLLGNQSVFDTPFSTTNFTRQQIDNQQAKYVDDIIAADPSVVIVGGKIGRSQDVTIRGFDVQNTNFTFLGLPGMADVCQRLDGIERIELLEGPNTLLNGAVGVNNIGGSINRVPKRAEDTPTRTLTTTYSSRYLFDTQVDLGQRLGDRNQWGVRVNLSGRGGGTAVDRQSESGSVGTAALDYRGERLRVSLDLSREATYDERYSNFFFVAPGTAVPKAPRSTVNPQPDGAKFSIVNSFGVAHAEYDVTDRISVFGTYGLSHYVQHFAGPATFQIQDVFGNATATILPIAQLANTEASEFGARAEVNTGPVRHRLSVATDRYDATFSSAFDFGGPTYNTNIYNPAPGPLYSNPSFNYHPPRSSESKRISYAAADTASVLDDRIQLTVGGRLQYIDERSFDADGTTSSRYRQNRISPTAALLVQPLPGLSLYANYIEQLNQGPTAPSFATNANAIFAPYVATQKEVGAKYDFGRVAATLSLFEIEQPQGVVNPLTNTFGVTGQQRNRGVELKTFGEVYAGVRVLGGVTILDGKQLDTQDSATDRKHAVGVPLANLAFGTEWDLPYVPRLTVGGRVNFVTRTFIDAANTQAVPGYAKLDISARYTIDRGSFGKSIVIRGGIDNVTGADYWQSSTFGSLTQSTPRTFYLSTAFSL